MAATRSKRPSSARGQARRAPAAAKHERVSRPRGRAEQLLRLGHAVTRILADSSSVAEALESALRAICETEGWDCAELWRVDAQAGVLRLHAHWAAGESAAARFAEASRDIVFEPGIGLVGAVWQSGEPLWIPDAMRDPRALRKRLSEETGLRAALLVPVHAGGRVDAVLDITSRRVRPADARLMQTLSVIGTQIGQFLQRAEAEEAMRASEARFRTVVDSANEGILVYDRDLTVVSGNAAAARIIGVPLEELIGKPGFTSLFPCVREDGSPLPAEERPTKVTTRTVQPLTGMVVGIVRPGGDITWLSVNTAFLRNPAEPVPYGIVSTIRDITPQKRAEQLLRLEHQVARLLSGAEDVSQGLCAVLRAVCEAEGWAVGRYFRLDEPTGVLRFSEAWCVPGADTEQFVERSRNLVRRRGEGLTGMAWQSGEPIWSSDMTIDPRVQLRSLSEGNDIRGAFLFPVMSEGRLIGVLSFTSHEVRRPDERLLQAAHIIGSQVGQFLRRKEAEASLRDSEARFRSLTQLSSDFFWETDAAHRFTQLVYGPGYQLAEMGRGIIGATPWELPSASPQPAGWDVFRATVEGHEPFRDFEFARPMPDGVTRYFTVSGEPHFAADGGFLGYRGVGRDITEIALARERIASLAYTDPLTGLANRTGFGPSLEQAVQRARRRGSRIAVIFLDLDGFKQINDAHGHDAGDALLVEVAARLRLNLRASDLVGRPGGDEFLVVLEEIQDAGQVAAVTRKLLGEMLREFVVGSAAVRVTASIGISLFPDDAADALALMKHADTAMYAAKQAGKNTFRFYTSGPAANEPQNAARTGAASRG